MQGFIYLFLTSYRTRMCEELAWGYSRGVIWDYEVEYVTVLVD